MKAVNGVDRHILYFLYFKNRQWKLLVWLIDSFGTKPFDIYFNSSWKYHLIYVYIRNESCWCG